jgi:RNA polymerase-binding transcription factor DksA
MKQLPSKAREEKPTSQKQPGDAARIAPKWKWHYRVLLGLRNRLLQARSEQLHEIAKPLEISAVDVAECATDEFDHDLALGRLSAEQDALYEVEEAIRRIENGAYGICDETGKPIEAGRLKAVPWTRFSHDAEAKLEKSGIIQRTRFGKVSSVRKPKSDMLWKNGIPAGQDTEGGRPTDEAEEESS